MISIEEVKVIHYIYKQVLQTTKLSLQKFVLPFIILYKFSLDNVENCLSAVVIADMIIIYSDYSSIDMISQNINNKYNMQTPPQTIHSSQTCILSCTSQQKHSSPHTKISLPILRELLLERINNYDIKSIPQVQAYINELKNLRKYIDTCIDNIQMEWKMQVSLGLSGDSFDACKILLGKTDVGVVMCKQVYMVEMAATQYNFQACKKVVVGKLDEMSVKLVVELSKYQEKFAKKQSQKMKKQGQKKQKQSMNIKKQEQQVKKQEKVDYIDQSISEIRPERHIIQKTQPSSARHERHDRNSKHSENEFKINQLFDKSTNVHFTTTFKVIKILGNVKILKIDKVKFVGADQTAKAIFIVDKSFDIQAGSTLRMTQCKLYDFHGSERQIQSTKYSKVSDGGNIGRVNTSISLQISGDSQRRPRSRNNRRVSPDEKIEHSPDPNEKNIADRSEKISKQNTSQSLTQSPKKLETKSSSTEYKKIKDIEPGDEDINIVAKIHEIIEIGTYKMVCYIGDDTGIVKIQLPTTLPFLKEGLGVKLLRVQSAVVDEHILIHINEGSKIEPMNIIFPKIDISNDVSFQEWQSDDD